MIQADGPTTAVEAAQLRRSARNSLILLPLNAGGRTIGMVELLARSGPREPTAAEMQACEAMASLAAAGLEKVRVLEQLRSAADMDLVRAFTTTATSRSGCARRSPVRRAAIRRSRC